MKRQREISFQPDFAITQKQDIIDKIIRQVDERCPDGELDITIAGAVILEEDRFAGHDNISLSHLSVTDNDLTVVGAYCSDVRYYAAEELTAKRLKEISSFLTEYVLVTRTRISTDEARAMLAKRTKSEYDQFVTQFMDSLFYAAVKDIEDNHIVDDELWHCRLAIRNVFYEKTCNGIVNAIIRNYGKQN